MTANSAKHHWRSFFMSCIQFNHRNQLPLRMGIRSGRKNNHDGEASDAPRHKQHLLSKKASIILGENLVKDRKQNQIK